MLLKAIIFPVIAYAPFALANPVLGVCAFRSPLCEPSAASPLSKDVTAVINQARGHGGTCSQGNAELGSRCQTQFTAGTAAISLCGTPGDQADCTLVAQYAEVIQNGSDEQGQCGPAQSCKETINGNEVVGGEFFISANLWVVVSHS